MNTQSNDQIAIVGHGIIGASWALVFARAGLEVRIWARNAESESSAKRNVESAVQAIAGTGLEGDSGTLGRISYHRRIEDVVDEASYVQESVPEEIEIKRQVYAAIEADASTSAVIASSTSGIMPSILAEGLEVPGRLIVAHPLTPPHLLPITEICAGSRTDEAVIERAINLLRAVGQHPIRLQAELPGFALNRVLGSLLKECFALIEAGVIRVADVDALFTQGFGLRWSVLGPLAAMDLNAPGGIRDYLQRYGKLFEAKPALIEEIATRFEEECAVGDRAARMRSRDRAIAQVAVYKRTLNQ